MASPLEVEVARLTIDDDATPQLKKVDKTVKQTSKSIDRTKKSTTDTGKEVKKTGNIFNKAFRKIQDGAKKTGKSIQGVTDRVKKMGKGTAAGVGGGVKKAAGVVQGAGTGGGLGGALGNVPIIGAVFAAAFASVESVRRDFISGLGIKSELLGLSNDFNIALKKERKGVLSAFSKDGFFRKEDIQAAAVDLADSGISGKAIKDNAGLLSDFAKSQGFTSISEAVGAVKGGQVKAGRGLDTADILQFQEISGLLNNVATAEIGFQLLTDILKRNSKEINKFSGETVTALGEVTRQQNEETQFQQDRAVKAASIDENLIQASRVFVETADSLKQTVAVGAGVPLGKVANFVKTKFPGRQLGGTAQAGRPFMIGERGPELFAPGQTGQIVNNDNVRKMASAGGGSTTPNKSISISAPNKSISISAPITVNVPPGTAAATAREFGRQFEREVGRVINKFASTVLREESGLTPERG